MGASQRYFLGVFIFLLSFGSSAQTGNLIFADECSYDYSVVKAKIILKDGRTKEGFLQVADDWMECRNPKNFKKGDELVGILSTVQEGRAYALDKPPEEIAFFRTVYTFKGARGLKSWQVNYHPGPDPEGPDYIPIMDSNIVYPVISEGDYEEVRFNSIKSIIFISNEGGFTGSGELPHVPAKDIMQWKQSKSYMVLRYPHVNLVQIVLVAIDPDYSQQEFYAFAQAYLAAFYDGEESCLYGDISNCEIGAITSASIENARNYTQQTINALASIPFKSKTMKYYMDEIKGRLSFYNALISFCDRGATDGLRVFAQSHLKHEKFRNEMLHAIEGDIANEQRIYIASDLVQLTAKDENFILPSQEKVNQALRSLRIQKYQWSYE